MKRHYYTKHLLYNIVKYSTYTLIHIISELKIGFISWRFMLLIWTIEVTYLDNWGHISGRWVLHIWAVIYLDGNISARHTMPSWLSAWSPPCWCNGRWLNILGTRDANICVRKLVWLKKMTSLMFRTQSFFQTIGCAFGPYFRIWTKIQTYCLTENHLNLSFPNAHGHASILITTIPKWVFSASCHCQLKDEILLVGRKIVKLKRSHSINLCYYKCLPS